MSEKIYPSKLLLFGEYTVIYGSQALAVPLYQYSGRWIEGASEYDFWPLWKYLRDLKEDGKLLSKIDTEKFKKDLEKGVVFDANIPIGYGLGSSGALCAGIFDRYGAEVEGQNLRSALAQMENFFHGASSGIDPLVCYLQKAILTEGKAMQVLEDVHLERENLTTFLVDTGKSRSTEPFVNIFKEKCQKDYYRGRIEAELVPLTENAIHALLNRQSGLLMEVLHELSYFQFRYFEPMILPDFRDVWLSGLSNNLFKLKLCGAGGGGMILGFTQDWEKTKDALQNYKIIKIGA